MFGYRVALALLIVVTIVGAPPGDAGTTEDPVIALHGIGLCGKATLSCPWPGFENCSPQRACRNYTTRRSAFEGTNLYVVVARADSGGVAGASFGIAIDGEPQIFGWGLCADEEFPSATWPVSGSGNRVIWDPDLDCQRSLFAPDGVHAIVGSFYIYSYGAGSVSVVNHPTSVPGVAMVDCSAREIAMEPGARVDYETGAGFNPCIASTPVQPSTWGRIKNATRTGGR